MCVREGLLAGPGVATGAPFLAVPPRDPLPTHTPGNRGQEMGGRGVDVEAVL